jgi:hypothetical protein
MVQCGDRSMRRSECDRRAREQQRHQEALAIEDVRRRDEEAQAAKAAKLAAERAAEQEKLAAARAVEEAARAVEEAARRQAMANNSRPRSLPNRRALRKLRSGAVTDSTKHRASGRAFGSGEIAWNTPMTCISTVSGCCKGDPLISTGLKRHVTAYGLSVAPSLRGTDQASSSNTGACTVRPCFWSIKQKACTGGS